MNYGEIKKIDIANGIGVRVSIFVSGCRNYCKNCFNQATWDFSYGKEYTDETENEIIDALKNSFIDGITFLGGEPFEPENQRGLIKLAKRIRKECPDKTIWCYTGFTLEEIRGESRANCEVTEELLSLIDVLVDGRFVEEEKDITLRFRGSRNQRLIDLKETLQSGKIVLWDK